MEKILNRTFICLAVLIGLLYYTISISYAILHRTSTVDSLTRKQIEDSMINVFSEKADMQLPKPIYADSMINVFSEKPEYHIVRQKELWPIGKQIHYYTDTTERGRGLKTERGDLGFRKDKPYFEFHLPPFHALYPTREATYVNVNGLRVSEYDILDSTGVIAQFDTCGDVKILRDSAVVLNELLKMEYKRFTSTNR